MLIRMKSGEPFAFAGLWEAGIPIKRMCFYPAPSSRRRPNVLMEKIHNRSPSSYRLRPIGCGSIPQSVHLMS